MTARDTCPITWMDHSPKTEIYHPPSREVSATVDWWVTLAPSHWNHPHSQGWTCYMHQRYFSHSKTPFPVRFITESHHILFILIRGYWEIRIIFEHWLDWCMCGFTHNLTNGGRDIFMESVTNTKRITLNKITITLTTCIQQRRKQWTPAVKTLLRKLTTQVILVLPLLCSER